MDLTLAPLEKWIKLCQSFVKFENVLNLILKFDSDTAPTNGDGNTNPKSNREAMMQAHEHGSNLVLHGSFQHCSELDNFDEKESLHRLFCPNPGQSCENPHPDKLCRLTILTDSALEPNAAKFCFAGQPVGLPGNTTTIIDLIHFCHTFVHNTMRFKSLSPLTENKTLQEQFALLAQHVIKDSLLEKHMMRPLFETALHNDEWEVVELPE